MNYKIAANIVHCCYNQQREQTDEDVLLLHIFRKDARTIFGKRGTPILLHHNSQQETRRS